MLQLAPLLELHRLGHVGVELLGVIHAPKTRVVDPADDDLHDELHGLLSTASLARRVALSPRRRAPKALAGLVPRRRSPRPPATPRRYARGRSAALDSLTRCVDSRDPRAATCPRPEHPARLLR